MRKALLALALIGCSPGCVSSSDTNETPAGLLDQTNHEGTGGGCGTLASVSKASLLTWTKYVEPTGKDVTYRAQCNFELPKTASSSATAVTLTRIDYGADDTVCAVVDPTTVKLFFAFHGSSEFFPQAVSKECAGMPATAPATAVLGGPIYCRAPGLDSAVTRTTEFKALMAGKLGDHFDPCTKPNEKLLLK